MFYSPIFSFALAQIFGVYFLILAIVMISRVDFFRHQIANLKPNNYALTIGAAFGVLLGLVLIDLHNIWVLAPRVLITVICWTILIKSLLWLAMPEAMLTLTQKLYRGWGYYAVVLTMTAISLILIIRGFYLFESRYLLHLGV